MVIVRKLWSKLASASDWQWLRDFFALSYLRYMMSWFAIVPVVAALLKGAPRELTVPFTTPHLAISLDLPFTWQVLWVGSLLFFLAFLIYQFRVPVFVRRYHSLDDYLAKGHSPRWIAWEARDLFVWGIDRNKFFKRLQTKHYLAPDGGQTPVDGADPLVLDKTTNFRFHHNGENYALAMPIVGENGLENADETSIAVREIFWELFGRYAESRYPERLTIKYLLLGAGLCVAFVVVQHLANTVPYVLSLFG